MKLRFKVINILKVTQLERARGFKPSSDQDVQAKKINVLKIFTEI